MAKLKQPLNSDQANGSVFGIVLASNPFGTIAHAKKSCSKANSLEQLKQQQRTSDLARAWAKLQPDQRKAWNKCSPRFMSGFNFYMSKSLTASRVQGEIVSVLTPSPNEHIFTQDCTPIIQDQWLQLDSGYQQTGYYFADLKIAPTNYFGKKLTIDMCPISAIVLTLPGEIIETGVFLPPGYTVIFMRFVSQYTGNASPWIMWELLS